MLKRSRAGGRATARGIVAASASVALILAAGAAPVAAEEWRSITIGESNDAAQQAELLAYFEAGADDKLATVSVEETLAAMAGIFDLEGVDTAYSSTALACREPGSGLEVSTRNIEVVSPELYALALVTAGIEDAELLVAAPDDAPALGMTALTGVFATMDGAPCGPGNGAAARQRFALEGLAMAASLGQAREEGEREAAARVVLETQREVVAGRGATAPGIAAIVEEREAAEGIELTGEEREGLVGLMTRLAEARLDWGAFGGGWTTDRSADGSRVAMVGARAAVRIGVGGPARQDATAEVPTAPRTGGTPSAPRAATPAAGLPTARDATPTAATPAASPAATPQASPAASPIAAAGTVGRSEPPDASVTGRVVELGDGGLAVDLSGGERRAIEASNPGAVVTRAGTVARLADVRPGDDVRITLDGTTGEAVRIDATTPVVDDRGWMERFGWLAAPLLIGLAAVVFARRRVGGALVSRGAVARPARMARSVVARPARALVARRRTWVFGRRRGATLE